MTIQQKFNEILNARRRREIRAQMVQEFGVNKSTVFNWLHGRTNPPPLYHRRIAEILETDINELFGNIDNRQN